ncbi:FliH/SctL family protein [Roseivivax sp. CAU 1753]
MRLADLLADFTTSGISFGTAAGDNLDAKEQEKHDLATFDQGYRAGWDDAVSAVDQEGKRLHSDFAQNLQDLAFTYREAYGHILAAMEPLLTEIADTILPAALHDSLGRHLTDRLLDHARSCGETLVEIAVSPAELSLVEPMVDADTGFPIKVVADGTLMPGQADIRFGDDHEERIDLTEIASEIREAITGFSTETRRTAHG